MLSLVGALLSACGSSDEPPPPAEPARSPPLSAEPAGRVVELGSEAEGLVADPRTGLVAVGLRDPDRLALIDGGTLELEREVGLPGDVRRVPIPESPRHLGLVPGGPVLVPAERADALARVALPGGEVETTPVGRFPHDAAAAAGAKRAFVANEFGDSVSVVDGGSVVETIRTPVQPGGVAVLDDRFLGVVTVRSNRLSLYDAVSLAPLGEVGAGAGPTHLVPVPGRGFYVVDTRGDAIVVIEVQDGEPVVVDRTNLPGAPYGIAIDPRRERLWVTLTERNELAELELTAKEPELVRTYPTVRQPNTVAVDRSTGRVFVAGRVEGGLQAIDPAYDG